MPHHGLLKNLEDGIERLVLNSSQQQNNPPMQQPMSYGQGTYGPGAMPYGGPPAGGMPYQQPGYGMQPQMMGSAYAPQMTSMGSQMAPYGQGYIDSGDGRPAMVYGGSYEGRGSIPYAYQQANPTGYQPSPIQGYAPGLQLGYQQGYPQVSQPSYPQGFPQAPQSPYPQGYPQPGQQGPQTPLYPIASQLQPQNIPTSQPPAQSPAPSVELPATHPHPQVAELPGSPPNAQSNQNATVQLTPQPTRSPAEQPNPQLNYAPSQLSPQQSDPFSPVPQSAAPPAYSPGSPPALQPDYLSKSQAPPSPNYSTGTPQPAYAGTYLNNAYANPPLQRPLVQMQTSSYGSQHSVPPNYLHPIDTMVKYDPVSDKADTHHHALKSLTKSSQAPEVLTAILGSYLATKQAHEGSRPMSTTGTYRHARPEVQVYCHTMDKLESLSVDFVAKHKTVPAAWLSAMGPHRRHVFATLYNNNEIVRNFCSDLPGGPLALPELDSYALGKTLTNFSFAKAITRAPSLHASFSVLSQVRTVILIDDSGSMVEPGHRSWGNNYGRSESRWTQARNLLASLAPLVAMHSAHGIDLHFLNRVPFYSGLRTSAAVEAAFDGDYPNNGTPIGHVVNDILDAYMCSLRHYRKMLPLNLIVITDGEAQDEHILHWTIEHHVTKIVHRGFPAHQFGVEFVQVGDCQHATRHLIRLEEEVSRHHSRFQRDVVGVTPTTRIGRMDANTLLGIAISGIDARMNGYMRTRGINV